MPPEPLPWDAPGDACARTVFEALHIAADKFRQLGLPAPAFVLDHREAGESLLDIIAESNFDWALQAGPPRLVESGNGGAFLEIEITGLKLRWPAIRKPESGGGFRFE